jgi:hypothetical protein
MSSQKDNRKLTQEELDFIGERFKHNVMNSSAIVSMLYAKAYMKIREEAYHFYNQNLFDEFDPTEETLNEREIAFEKYGFFFDLFEKKKVIVKVSPFKTVLEIENSINENVERFVTYRAKVEAELQRLNSNLHNPNLKK